MKCPHAPPLRPQEKQALLEAAGAELGAPAGGGAGGGGAAIPLRVGSYTPVCSHMLKADFLETLAAQGVWDPHAPTIWLACERGGGGPGWHMGCLGAGAAAAAAAAAA